MTLQMADKLITFVFMVLMTIKDLLLTDDIKRYLPLSHIFGVHKASPYIKGLFLTPSSGKWKFEGGDFQNQLCGEELEDHPRRQYNTQAVVHL